VPRAQRVSTLRRDPGRNIATRWHVRRIPNDDLSLAHLALEIPYKHAQHRPESASADATLLEAPRAWLASSRERKSARRPRREVDAREGGSVADGVSTSLFDGAS